MQVFPLKLYLKILHSNNNNLTNFILRNILATLMLLLRNTCKNRVFVFPGFRPFAWPPAPASIPGPKFVFTGTGPRFVFTGPGTKFVLIGPGPKSLFTDSTRPEFAHTDLVSPVCIYWPWSMICRHTGC